MLPCAKGLSCTLVCFSTRLILRKMTEYRNIGLVVVDPKEPKGGDQKRSWSGSFCIAIKRGGGRGFTTNLPDHCMFIPSLVKEKIRTTPLTGFFLSLKLIRANDHTDLGRCT